ncbi:hypothetical protein [Undibacterium sp. Ji49W]|uniref:hypothetical protein n=1 Tax=Undibacterium sp. Ji49W TaxID=3413040 RepID=UPI003BF2DDE7
MKEITDQMVGFVVKVPCEYDVHPSVPEEEYEAVLEQCADVEENLASFARQFPDDTVVYVFIDCFGGVCDHTGFHILGGEVVKTFVHSRTGAVQLADLLAPMHVSLGQFDYFEPFTRDYFSQ